MTIKDLLAYTTYRVNIAMWNGKEIGPWQDVQNITDSTTPTPPQNLTVKQQYSRKLLLQWVPPKLWNGFAQKYVIFYMNARMRFPEKVTVEQTNEQQLPTEYELINLNSFTDYEIQMIACNPDCSMSSNVIATKTLIGEPGEVQNFHQTDEKFNWNEPELKGGHINFYEFRANFHHEVSYDKIRVLNTNQCNLRVKTCENPSDRYTFYVRAVNVVSRKHYPNITLERSAMDAYEGLGSNLKTDGICFEDIGDIEMRHIRDDCNKNGYCFYGPWSKPYIVQCASAKNAKTFPIFYTMLGFILFISILYVLIQSVKKFKKMKDIGIVIPPGLEDISGKSPESTKSKMTDDSYSNEDEQTRQLIGTIQKSNSSISFDNKEGRTSEFSESDHENPMTDEQISNPEYEPVDRSSPILYINGRGDHKQLVDPQSHQQYKKPTIHGDGLMKSTSLDDQPTMKNGMGPIKQQQPPVHQIMSNNYVSPNIFMKPAVNGIGVGGGGSGYVTHDTMIQMPVASSGYTPFSAVINSNKVSLNFPFFFLNLLLFFSNGGYVETY